MSVKKKRKLLVVDDIEVNRMVLSNLFMEEFEVLEAENGEVALNIINSYASEISVVLLDLAMPVMDGFQVLEEMQKSGIIHLVPVIMITGENDDEKMLTGYKLGVSDLVNKPFNSDIVIRRVNNVIDLYEHKNYLERKLNEQKEILEKQAQKLIQANHFVMDALSTTVEFRNFESGTHTKRIRIFSKILLESMADIYGFSSETIESMSNASVVHDIGKIAIPDLILLKPGPLTSEEYEIMKTHTIRGCEILESLDYMQDRDYYRYCYDICRYHHERWDGRGYPDGLKGDEIPIWAQATSLADVYDALTNKRVYKAAYTHEEAFRMIINGECGVFNPLLIEHFIKVEDLFKEQLKQIISGNNPLIKE
ncbi:response regulator [Eubacteriales bacterium OttesenSCG-928-G02]|nr:response regulator [Eubacteriales bacterium OttesenSCG-928-G02]